VFDVGDDTSCESCGLGISAHDVASGVDEDHEAVVAEAAVLTYRCHAHRAYDAPDLRRISRQEVPAVRVNAEARRIASKDGRGVGDRIEGDGRETHTEPRPAASTSAWARAS
jgi:hypothetical protein